MEQEAIIYDINGMLIAMINNQGNVNLFAFTSQNNILSWTVIRSWMPESRLPFFNVSTCAEVESSSS